MTIFCSKRNLVVKAEGEIDHHSAEEIRQKVDKEYKKNNSKNIVFDFSSVTFMDSSGVGMLIGRLKRAQNYGGTVCVCAISPEARRVFDISGLYKIIRVYDDAETALAAM